MMEVKPPLRVSLITPGLAVPVWLADVISAMQAERNVVVVQIISIEKENAATRRQRIEAHYYRLQEAVETFKGRKVAGRNGLTIDALSRYPDAILSSANETGVFDGIDLLMNCGVTESRFKLLRGAMNALSYNFSGASNDLGLFRAMIYGETGLSISVDYFEGDNETLLEYARPALPERPSLRDLQGAVHDRAAVVITKALRILTNGRDPLTRQIEAPLYPVRFVDTEGMFRFVLRRGVESLKGRLVRLRPEKYWAVDDYNWFLAYRMKSDDFVCSTRCFCADGFKLLLPPPGKFYADPCVFRHKGVDHVFFEEWHYKTHKGHICWTTLKQDGQFSDPEAVLAESHHLSYPFVFEEDGDIYMIPESSEAKSVNLYKAVEFPKRWEKVATLLDNVSAADATVMKHEGRWWMFATVGENGSSKNDQLHLYFADQIFGPWHPHQNNPVKIDVGSARPGGRPYLWHGKLIRPSQNCSVTYGGALVLSEIIHLSPERYIEAKVDELSPAWLPFNVAFHTLASTDTLEVIDGRMTAQGNRRFPKTIL